MGSIGTDNLQMKSYSKKDIQLVLDALEKR